MKCKRVSNARKAAAASEDGAAGGQLVRGGCGGAQRQVAYCVDRIGGGGYLCMCYVNKVVNEREIILGHVFGPIILLPMSPLALSPLELSNSIEQPRS